MILAMLHHNPEKINKSSNNTNYITILKKIDYMDSKNGLNEFCETMSKEFN